MDATQAHDRAGRLADDVLPHPDGRAVLLRHVLPARPAARHARVPPAARRRVARPGARTASGCGAPPGEIAGRLADAGGARRCPPRPSTPAAARRRRRRAARGRSTRRRGGFGGAPKFPPSMVLEFLLRHHERTGLGHRAAHGRADLRRDGPRRHVRPARRRLRALQRRRAWVVPHFEKMLYDNALLLRVYAHWGRRTGVAAGAAGRRRDRRLPAARPAHRRGRVRLGAGRRHRRRRGHDLRRGRPAQLREVLGADDGAWAAQLFTVTDAGTFEHGASTLQLPADPDDARALGTGPGRAAGRPRRPPPARPRRQGGHRLERAGDRRARRGRRRARPARPGSTPPRRARPSCCWSCHLVDGRLRRTSRDGVVGAAAGVLEDYADLADGLLALHQATGAARWLAAASRAARRGAGAFRRHADSGPSSTPPTTPRRCCTGPVRSPTTRRRPAAPRWPRRCSPHAVLTGDGDRYRAAGRGGAARRGHAVARAPPVRRALARPRPRRRPRARCRSRSRATRRRRAAGQRAARRPGGTVIVAGAPDAPGVPLLAARPLVDGAARGLRLPRLRLRPPRHHARRLAAAVRPR